MPRISAQEFEQVALRVHSFLAGVPLHDVWVIDLPRYRSGITLDEFLREVNDRPKHLSPATRVLLAIRLLAGRLLGWEREPKTEWQPFVGRLTEDDRSRSLAPPGTVEGHFRIVYRFQNEQLLEIVNRTVHAAALSALEDTGDSYRFYFAVYVVNIGRFTPIYMALIDPFRKLIVYPSLLRSVRVTWTQAFAPK